MGKVTGFMEFERIEEGLAEMLDGTPFLGWLPVRDMELQPLLPGQEAMCVALGALVPCLLGYSVIRHRGRRALFALLALLAVWLWRGIARDLGLVVTGSSDQISRA